MSTKRKGDDSKGKKSPKTLKRAGTMDVTAQEGKEFLEQEAPELVKTPKGKEGVETRGKTQARAAIDDLLSSKKTLEELSPEEKKKEENKLKMVFRLFDKDKDGFLDADELMEALRTCGKKPTKAKVTKMITSMSSQKKHDTISSDDFTKYMLNKLYKDKPAAKEEPKEKEKEKSKEPEKTPEKAADKKGGKGKKAAAKKEKEADKAKEKSPEKTTTTPEKKDKGKSPASSSSSTTTTTKTLERGRSITEFYTEHAGMNNEITAEHLDKYSNPVGVEYDLGVEGAFNGFKILIGSFQGYYSKQEMEKNTKPALATKGFEIIYTNSEQEFIDTLPRVNVAWFLSSGSEVPLKAKFVEACKKFHETGGGLFIWADNQPLYTHANEVLRVLVGTELTGETYAGKNLTLGDSNTPGHFSNHLITSGIKSLYEGITISYPLKDKKSVLKPVATSTDNNPVILVAEQGEDGLREGCGRMVVDCGYTKLYDTYWTTAGTSRYVVNATVWLLGLDHRLSKGMPLSRTEAESN